MPSSGLNHIALRTLDIKETERFYTQVLGLKVAFRPGPDMIFLRTPGSSDLLNFIKSTKRFSGEQALDHIGFKVTQAGLKRIEKKLKENGIKLKGRRGRNAIYIVDSNGYQIEYYCD
jgi:catechol 2,3-dioxygenase-like lactoylglutathione lyase family enzyme